MNQRTGQRINDWSGPALLSYGFRPFFLGAAVWAAMAMSIWLLMLSGHARLPTAFDPGSWHAHEFLFGYLGAVVAGFLLTAVPNWTGRPPIVGWRLGALAVLWLLGRGAVAMSANLSPILVAVIDLAFPLLLLAAIAREIIAGKNWRNVTVLALLMALALGNAVFHWEAARGEYAAQGLGLRLGLGAGIMMIAVIGGRIAPSFTRNWLVGRGRASLPVPPMQVFDRVAILALLGTLLLWTVSPTDVTTGAALVVTGVLHIVRLARWSGHMTLAEPLVTILHAGYAFLPLGALALGAEILEPDLLGMAAAQHLWMGGAIGVMTLAVMTRAILGHTGLALSAGPGTIAIYAGVVLAVLLRIAAGLLPIEVTLLHMCSGLLWIGSFAGFAVLYGNLLLRLPDPNRT